MEAGRELDSLIAEKVMGWRLLLPATSDHGYIREGVALRKPIPRFSTDIAAAWLILEKLEQQDWHARVSHYQLRPVRWNCRLVPAYAPEAYEFADAPTAPHAICLAALKAVGVQ